MAVASVQTASSLVEAANSNPDLYSALDVVKVLIPEVKEKILASLKKKGAVGKDVTDVASLPPLQLPDASASSSAKGGTKARKVCSYKEMSWVVVTDCVLLWFLHCQSELSFDELSRATIESLKKTLCQQNDYKRFEPLLDWGFALADGQVWSKAVNARKSLISIEAVKAWKKENIAKCYDASSAKTFTGVLNEKHMMVVVSADLCLEDKNGWQSTPTPRNTAQSDWFKERLKFALDLTTSGNVLTFLFDGRSREAHRMPVP
eukprot:s3211_g3.t1